MAHLGLLHVSVLLVVYSLIGSEVCWHTVGSTCLVVVSSARKAASEMVLNEGRGVIPRPRICTPSIVGPDCADGDFVRGEELLSGTKESMLLSCCCLEGPTSRVRQEAGFSSPVSAECFCYTPSGSVPSVETSGSGLCA